MASRTEDFGWLTVLLAVVLVHNWVQSADPLAAQLRLQRQVEGSMESQAGNVPATANGLIEQMARAAGVIFAGQVIAVRRPIGFTSSAGGSVEVNFRVDQAVRGPASGSVYTLHEWPGLWTGNSRRYRIGQRLLVFFYPPDANGLSSPVHGAEGAVPLRGGGIAPGPDDAVAGAAEWNVDLRWIQAQVLREQHGLTPPERAPIYPIDPVSPGPGRGITPEVYTGQHQLRSDNALCRRLPDPLPFTVGMSVELEPLSQVIVLCRQAMQDDAKRHRDGSR